MTRFQALGTCLLVLLLLAGACHASAETLRDRVAYRMAAHMDAMAADDGSAEAAALPPGVKLLRDVAYGSDRLQAVDVYVPAAR